MSKLYILLWIDLYYMLTSLRLPEGEQLAFYDIQLSTVSVRSLEYVRLEFLARNSHHHWGLPLGVSYHVDLASWKTEFDPSALSISMNGAAGS